MQYRSPLGSGPSGNMWPKWPSQVLHITSTRSIPNIVSFSYFIAFSFMGCVKLGHPVPDSNFIVESNKGVSQHIQLYLPASWILHNAPEWGASVPFLRVILNCSGVNNSRHSDSVFSILRSGFGLPFTLKLITSFQLNIAFPFFWFIIQSYLTNTQNLLCIYPLLLYIFLKKFTAGLCIL